MTGPSDHDHRRNVRRLVSSRALDGVASGIRAVLAFPVPLDTHLVGVLSVYRATAGMLSTIDRQRVNRYSHNVTALLRDTAHVKQRRGGEDATAPTAPARSSGPSAS